MSCRSSGRAETASGGSPPRSSARGREQARGEHEPAGGEGGRHRRPLVRPLGGEERPAPSTTEPRATSSGDGPVWIEMCPSQRSIDGSCGMRWKRNCRSGTIDTSCPPPGRRRRGRGSGWSRPPARRWRARGPSRPAGGAGSATTSLGRGRRRRPGTAAPAAPPRPPPRPRGGVSPVVPLLDRLEQDLLLEAVPLPARVVAAVADGRVAVEQRVAGGAALGGARQRQPPGEVGVGGDDQAEALVELPGRGCRAGQPCPVTTTIVGRPSTASTPAPARRASAPRSAAAPSPEPSAGR
jgi:hypothetical protein